MGFVLASALVVLGALGLTLWHMFPLSRPQVFFLATQMRPNMDVRLYSMPIKSDPNNIDRYIRYFVQEYVRARNEIVPSTKLMQQKWGNGDDGIVNTWSTPDVYRDFVATQMWNTIMYPNVNIDMSCTVEFQQGGPIKSTHDGKTWRVNFSYLCVNSDGQTARKDYTIILDIAQEDTIQWGDRLNNPLGIKVSRYAVESDNGDPLDFQ